MGTFHLRDVLYLLKVNLTLKQEILHPTQFVKFVRMKLQRVLTVALIKNLALSGVEGGGQLPVPGGEELLLPVPEELQRHLRVGRASFCTRAKTAAPSAASRFMNFSRAGCCRRGPRTTRVVPRGARRAPQRGPRPPSTVRAVPRSSWAGCE